MAILSTRPPATWQVDGSPDVITFPIEGYRDSVERRIPVRERPYRDGAKLDDTGRGPITWTITTSLFDGVTEDGVPVAQYSEVLPKFFTSFLERRTGNLTIPQLGTVRARAKTWQREESPDERDVARLTLTWIEDNEDDVDATVFEQFSARSVIAQFASETVKDLLKVGIPPKDAFNLRDLAAKLETIAQTPGAYLSDLETQAAQVQEFCDRIEDAYTNVGVRGNEAIRERFLSPENYSGIRNLRNLRDLAARAYYEQLSSKPKIKTVRYKTEESIFTIAVKESNKVEDVQELNSKLLDPFAIPPGTPIRVYESIG